MRQLWWLSFCDGKRPKGEQFLGVAVMDFEEPVSAEALAPAAWLRGCNPGGQIAMLELPPNADPATPAEYRNRVLMREEVEALELIHEAYVREHGYMADERPDPDVACQECNVPEPVE